MSQSTPAPFPTATVADVSLMAILDLPEVLSVSVTRTIEGEYRALVAFDADELGYERSASATYPSAHAAVGAASRDVFTFIAARRAESTRLVFTDEAGG